MVATSKVEQAAGVIQALIEAGQPGDRLPRESDLAILAGVSRVTLREALNRLWQEGHIVRRWGTGTFIADAEPLGAGPLARSIYVSARGVMPLADDIRRQGHEPALRSFAVERWSAPEWVGTEALGETVWRVTRCLSVDGTPAVLIRDYLPLSQEDDPVELSQLSTDLARYLTARGVRLVKHESVLNAALCDADSARHLDLAAGAPVLHARQRAIADTGDVAACADIFYRSEVFGTVLVRTVRD